MKAETNYFYIFFLVDFSFKYGVTVKTARVKTNSLRVKFTSEAAAKPES